MLSMTSAMRKPRSTKEHADNVGRHPLAFAKSSADVKDMVMHDLGNSLDTLLACADSLLEEPYLRRTSKRGLVQTVKSAAELMRHLLNEYYRQSGLIKESPALPRLVTLNPILREVGKLFEPLGANREVQIRYQLEEDLPPITADALALQRIFINLVHNAVRFTFHQGLVTLVSHYRGHHVVASVIDTGVGITSNWRRARERLGLPYQSDLRGIGLTVVEHLVRATGGEFQIESNLGTGTSFHVCFPVASGDKPSEVAA
jgi:two-component system, OmpR family, phosphate regulon sensor histidine kinase PhoR